MNGISSQMNEQDLLKEQSETEEPASSPSLWSRIRKFLFLESSNDDLRDQLEEAIGLVDADSTSFSTQERLMISNILRYGALRVEDVMVPRADIQAIEENATLQELLSDFQKGGHSRLPVYRGTLDHPTGMIHVKDVLSWVADNTNFAKTQESALSLDNKGLKVISGGGGGGAQVASEADNFVPTESNEKRKHSETDFLIPLKETNLRRNVLFVPPSMPVMNLLLRMQSTRVHLALVVDEYGGTDGLVSIEDLVEEVVGDIEDEHDENNGAYIKGRLETGLVASARVPIEDLEEELSVNLFEGEERDDDIDTLGGLIFSLLGRVPVRGEVITHPAGFEIEVLNADPRRIKTLKLTAKKSRKKKLI